MLHRIILLVSIGISTLGFTQKIPEMEYMLRQSISITVNGIVIHAHHLAETEDITPEPRTVYFWYKNGAIHHTRGGISGKPLQGDYEEYYHSGNLKTQGQFHKGMKVGVWKEWHENGEMKSTTHWKAGKMEGIYYEYDEHGEETVKARYKDDKLNGKYIDRVSNKKTRFKDGKTKSDDIWWKQIAHHHHQKSLPSHNKKQIITDSMTIKPAAQPQNSNPYSYQQKDPYAVQSTTPTYNTTTPQQPVIQSNSNEQQANQVKKKSFDWKKLWPFRKKNKTQEVSNMPQGSTTQPAPQETKPKKEKKAKKEKTKKASSN